MVAPTIPDAESTPEMGIGSGQTPPFNLYSMYGFLCVCVSSRVHPSLSVQHMGISFFFAGFDIGSIRARHETSTELSSSSGDGTHPLQYLIPDPGLPIHRFLQKKVFTKNARSRAHLRLRSSSWAFWTPHSYVLIGGVVSFA